MAAGRLTMSRETAQIYQRVNDAWCGRGKEVPPLAVASKAVRALWREALGKALKAKVIETSGNRTTGLTRRDGVRVLSVNCGSGWATIVHHLSHEAHIYRPKPAGEHRHHGPSHAVLELRLVRLVLDKGWLDEPPSTPKPKADPRLVRAVRVAQRIAAWEAKQRRAANALKKLRRQQAYYERVLVSEAA